MDENITIKDVDDLISFLNFSPKSKKDQFIKTLRFYYRKDEDLLKIKSIKSDEVILQIWPPDADVGLKEIAQYMKAKRKDLSSLKSQINHQCRELFWEGKNPLRIGISRFNTLRHLKETKEEQMHRLTTKIKYLENIISSVDPEKLDNLEDKTTIEAVKKIKTDVESLKKKGISFDLNADFIFKKELGSYDAEKELSERELEHSKLIIDAKDETANLLKKLSSLNQEVRQIYHDINHGNISEAEGEKKLASVKEERDKVAKVAKQLTDTLKGIKEEDDPVLASAVEKIRENLKDFLKDRKDIDPTLLQNLLNKGLEAIEKFEESLKKETKDDVQFKNKKAIEKEFHALKEEARQLLNQLKPLNSKIKPLLKKQKTVSGLTDTEKNELGSYQEELLKLKEKGEEILHKLKLIEEQSEGAIKEASGLIISALEKFLQVKDTKKEILVLAEKNEKLMENLKEEEKALSSHVDKSKESLIKTKTDQLSELEGDFERIQKDIDEKKAFLKEAKEKAQKLEEEKQALEYDTKTTTDKLKELAPDKYPQEKPELPMESLLSISLATKKLANQFKELNAQYEKIEQDLKNGKISQEDSQQKLQEIDEQRKQLTNKAGSMVERISNIETQIDEYKNPSLMEVTQRIKQSLQHLFKEHDVSAEILKQAAQRGVDAFKDLYKAEKKWEESKQMLPAEKTQDLTDTFLPLKDEAKSIMQEFKKMSKRLDELNQLDALTEEQKEEYEEIRKQWADTEEKGKKVIEDMGEILNEADGPVKESASLVVSGLKRYISDILEIPASQLKENIADGKVIVLNLEKGREDLEDVLKEIKKADLPTAIAEEEQKKKTKTYFKDAFSKEEEAEADFKKGEETLENLKPTTSEEKQVKEEISEKKENAKQLVSDFKETNQKMAELKTKQKEEGPLSEADKQELKSNEQKQKELEYKAKQIMAELENIASRGDDVVKESASCLIRSLKKFTNQVKEAFHEQAEKIIIKEKAVDHYYKDAFLKEGEAEADFKKAEESLENVTPTTRQEEQIKEEISDKKEEAKQLVSDFKETNQKMAELRTKQKEEGPLSEPEQQEFKTNDLKQNELVEKAHKIMDELSNIASQGDQKIKESAEFIKNSLQKFTKEIQDAFQHQTTKLFPEETIAEQKEKLENISGEYEKLKQEIQDLKEPTGKTADHHYKDAFSKEAEAEADFKKGEETLENVKPATKEEQQVKENISEKKEEAKQLVSDFKETNQKMAELRTKQKEEGPLNEPDQQELKQNDLKQNELVEKAHKIMDELSNIASQGDQKIKDSAEFIKNSLQKFTTEIKDAFQHQTANLLPKETIAEQKEKLENISGEYEKLKQEIQDLREQKGGPPKVSKEEIETSQHIAKVKQETAVVIKKLEELNEEAEQIYTLLSEGKISEEEGVKRLKEIKEEKVKIAQTANKLNDMIKEISEEDPMLTETISKLKQSIKEIIKEKKDIDLDEIEDSLRKSLEASQEMEKAEQKDTKDKVDFKDKESIEKEFQRLKNEAKNILQKFKELNLKIKPLLQKEKGLSGLDDTEKKELARLKNELSELHKKGEEVLKSLTEIEEKSEGAIKETAKMVISALEKMIQPQEAKKKVLSMIEENKKIVDDLKEEEKGLESFTDTVWKKVLASRPKDLENIKDLTFTDKVQFAKTDSHRLALQLDMLLGESKMVWADDKTASEEVLELKEDAQELSQSLERITDKGKRIHKTIEDISQGETVEADKEAQQKETMVDMVLFLKSESKQLAQQLKKVNKEYGELQKDISEKRISVDAAQHEMKFLENKRSALQKQAKQISQRIDLMEGKLETAKNPKLAEATDRIKESLTSLMQQKGFSEEVLKKAVERGIKAIENFSLAEKKLSEVKDSPEVKGLMKQFLPLKDQAKQLIQDLKRIDKRTKELDQVVMNEEEQQEYDDLTTQRAKIADKGKILIKDMEEILKHAQGPLKEAASLVVSSLKRFIKDMVEVPAQHLKDFTDEKVILLNLEKGEKSLEEIAEEIRSQKEAPSEISSKEEVKEKVTPKEAEKEDLEKHFKNVFSKEKEATQEFKEGEKQIEEKKDDLDKQGDMKDAFISLKDQAKDLITQFRTTDKKMAQIRTQEQEKGELTSDEQKELSDIEQKRQDLEEKGKEIIAELENLSNKAGGAVKESSKFIVSSLKKFVTDIKDVFMDHLNQMIAKEEKVALPQGYELTDLDKKSLDESQQSLHDLIQNLQQSSSFLTKLNEKYFPYDQQIDEKDKGYLQKLSNEQEKFQGKARSLSIEIRKLISKLKIGDQESKDTELGSGISMLEQSMEHIKDGNISQALDNLDNAIVEFKESDRRMNFIKQREKPPIPTNQTDQAFPTKQPDQAFDEEGVFNIIKGHEGLSEEMIEIEGAFFIDRYPITIAQFKRFILETEYKTKAEFDGFGWVYQKQGWLTEETRQGVKIAIIQSTRSFGKEDGAYWAYPDGVRSNIMDIASGIHYPTTQVTFADALAYAQWAEKRLPTEAEWKLATCIKNQQKYPWGDEADVTRCNNKKANFRTLAPVNNFKHNDYGVYDMIGNTWEWCESGTDEYKLILGGCWNMDINEMADIAVEKRDPNNFTNTIGFRCVRQI